MDKQKPKSQKEISKSKQTPYSKERGNPNIDNNNRGQHTSFKGDTVKPIYIGIEDIDNSILYYFENIIKPFVVQNNERIPVPVIYGSPERWKSYQKDGYYRDNNGKIMAPLIMFKMESMEKDRSKTNKLDANNPNNYSINSKKYSPKNTYDNFSVLNNKKPETTFYATVVPDYIVLNYNCVIFTNYAYQLNKLIENIQYASDAYWGDPERFQFNARIDSFGITNEINIGEDKIIKSTFNIKIKGYIVPDNIQKDVNSIKKFRDKSTIIFELEEDYNPLSESKPIYKPKPIRVCEPVQIRSTDNSILIESVNSGERYLIPAANIVYTNNSGSLNSLYWEITGVSGSYLILTGTNYPIPRFTIYESDGITVRTYRDINSPSYTIPSGGISNLSISNSIDQELFIISSSFSLPPVQLKYINSGGIIYRWNNFNITQSNGYSNFILISASLIPSFSIFRSGSNTPTASKDILNPNYTLYPTEIKTGLSGTQISVFDEYYLQPVRIKHYNADNTIDEFDLQIEKLTGSGLDTQFPYEQPGDQHYPIPRFTIYESDGITVRTYRDINSPSYTESIFTVSGGEDLIFSSTTSSWNIFDTRIFYYTNLTTTSSYLDITRINSSGSYLYLREHSGSIVNPLPLFKIYHYDSSLYLFSNILNPNIYLSGSRIQNSNNSYTGTLKEGNTGSIPNTYLINSGSSWTGSVPSAVTSSIPNTYLKNSDNSYSRSIASAVTYSIEDNSIILPNSNTTSSIYGNVIDIRTYASGIVYNFGKIFWSGQTTVYRTGDEGSLYSQSWFNYTKPPYPSTYSELTDFYTLSNNNIHGNTSRFTDRTGSVVFDTGSARVIQDHLTGIEWYRASTLSTVTWNQAIDSSSNSTVEGNSDWWLPPFEILWSIADLSLADIFNHTGFVSVIGTDALWTSTTVPSTTTNAIRMLGALSAGPAQGVAKTTTNRFIYCRKFIN